MITAQNIEIEITPAAIEQIHLIQTHDYTLADQVFRLSIDGKGCGGFDYALGFSQSAKEDLILERKHGEITIQIHLDQFAAYYCQEGKIEYMQNPETGEDGFVFTNKNEKSYRGKFFKDESKVPEIN